MYYLANIDELLFHKLVNNSGFSVTELYSTLKYNTHPQTGIQSFWLLFKSLEYLLFSQIAFRIHFPLSFSAIWTASMESRIFRDNSFICKTRALISNKHFFLQQILSLESLLTVLPTVAVVEFPQNQDQVPLPLQLASSLSFHCRILTGIGFNLNLCRHFECYFFHYHSNAH